MKEEEDEELLWQADFLWRQDMSKKEITNVLEKVIEGRTADAL